MLRLWPESLYVGLFPGCCWLRRGGADLALPPDFKPGGTPAELLQALDTMLALHAKTIRKGARLHVQVSDSAGVLVTLPWQDQLASQEELAGYAHACFEQHGLDIDERWTVQTGFRHHRETGIAYAIQTEWLRALVELTAAHGFRLASVLPVSASAYWRLPPVAGQGQGVTLLREAHRITAMVRTGRRLLAVDVEPVVGSAESAGTRLLRRVCSAHQAIGSVSYWSDVREDAATAPVYIAACLPDVDSVSLSRDVWA